MRWPLADVQLDIGRVPRPDARRQKRTAREILRRLERQPGVILADEVGMGKTYVALAVAVSAAEATGNQVVVMVPPGVKEKWPQEWEVFREKCLGGHSDLRATDTTIGRGADFLKLLDDPESRRKDIIFLSHTALASSMGDDFIKFALVRQAFMYQRNLSRQWRVLPKWAPHLFNHPAFRNEPLVRALLDSPPRYWLSIARRHMASPPGDDPIPESLIDTIHHLDLTDLRTALRHLPLKSSGYIDARLRDVRKELDRATSGIWRDWVALTQLHRPLLIMDEAHHLRNPWTRLAKLFSPESDAAGQLVKGPLANVFDRMLFLTATPFQLGHHELIQVLQRFESVRWKSGQKRREFHDELDSLLRVLDDAQFAALRLDTVWGRLAAEDVIANEDGLQWWEGADQTDPARAALDQIDIAEEKVRKVETTLRRWVIRHVKPGKDTRRAVYPGAGIVDLTTEAAGLPVKGSAVLPFLLAARAQGLVAREVVDQTRGAAVRAYFAEGLGSSFEAYRDTRSRVKLAVDEDGASLVADGVFTSEVQWYLDHLDKALPRADDTMGAQHPKVAATVGRVRQLWGEGEKVVVFCFYVATGRALRYHISRALEEEIVTLGSARLGGGVEPREVLARLDQLGERFFGEDSAAGRATVAACMSILSTCGLSDSDLTGAASIIARFLRTPSFLARYVNLADDDLPRAYEEALGATDASGMQLRAKIESFGHFLADRVPAERVGIFDALKELPTGRIRAASAQAYDPSELGDRPGVLLPNVRLVNGGVKRDTRRRLMYAFNTPFFPEVLIASAVLAEGVDLHLDCRTVIHHDLDWNPSVLEQRTGRVDRLGSKAAVTGKPIVVFEPYVAGTQDEKQYRVVKDRQRWFSVVMGESLKLDEHSTDLLASRIELPSALSDRLTLELGIGGRSRSAG